MDLNKSGQNPLAGTYFETLKMSPPSDRINDNMREHVTNSSDPIIHRLDYIETNLNKICSQHDALMPLLVLKDQGPLLSKTENTVKSLQKKLGDSEEKMKILATKFKDFQKGYENDRHKIYIKKREKGQEIPNIDKTLKGLSNHINNLQTNLKDIESKVLSLQKVTENKLKDEKHSINKEIEKMVDVNKNEIQNMIAEFKNRIELALKKQLNVYKEIKKNKSNISNDKSQDENIDKDKLIEDIHNITSGKIDNYIEVIKTDYEKEINELYKDVGSLKCEIEIFNDQSRKEQMMENLKNLPKDTDIFEKKTKINNLEQTLFLTTF